MFFVLELMGCNDRTRVADATGCPIVEVLQEIGKDKDELHKSPIEIALEGVVAPPEVHGLIFPFHCLVILSRKVLEKRFR